MNQRDVCGYHECLDHIEAITMEPIMAGDTPDVMLPCRRIVVSLVLLLFCVPAGRSAEVLDPQTERPYEWRVVLHCSPHPLLGPRFRERLVRDIHAALQPSVGESARVEVVDLAAISPEKRDPLATAFAKHGWAALPTDPKIPRELTGVKTHFLTVTVRGRTFRLEARQLDGDTGLVSPLLRTRETSAPEQVGRLAGMMLGQDFGAVGTVIDSDRNGEWVRIRLRAAGRGDPAAFVAAGDVFAVATILKPPTPSRRGKAPVEPESPPTALPREYTLFRATEPPTPSGTLKCVVLTQYETALPRLAGIAGFRCLKLATIEAPMKVRVVGADGGPPPAGLPVRVRAVESDFEVRPHPRDYLMLRDGVFRSDRRFRNVACVSVGLGGALGERRFPLPVLSTDAPHVVPYSVTEEEIAKAAFERRCEDLRGKVAEARQAERALFEGLAKLIYDGKNQDALVRATTGRNRLVAADEQFTTMLDRLKSDPGAKDPFPAALLQSTETMLLALRDSRPRLAGTIEDLQTAIKKAEDPVRFEKEFRAKEMVAQIKQYLDYGDVPEALALYDALFALTMQDDVKKQRDKLAKEWEPKGPDHTAARDFIAKDWRAAGTVAEYQSALPKLKESTDTLNKYDDRHGLRMLLTSLEPVHARLKQMADVLDANSEVDRPKLREIQGVVNGLLEVETSARDKLKELSGEAIPTGS